jgi:hypothetical protein
MKKISKYILLLLTPLAFLTIQGCVGEAKSNIVSEEVTYTDGDITMKGYIAYDDSIKGKRPGVIVVHEWWGHNDYSRKRADMLAKEGYTAIALDMFGDGKKHGSSKRCQGFCN